MIRFCFFIKKALLYLMFGITATTSTLFPLGTVFGLPSVLLCSILLAINDACQLDAHNIPPIFTKKMCLIFVIEVIVVVLAIVIFS